jgi:hypothetical protein
MMTRTFVLMMGVAALVIAPALAQQPPPAPTPAPPRSATPAAAPAPAPAPPPRQGQPINVKIDLSINDQRGGSPPVKRTLSMICADGVSGSIRSQSEVLAVGPVPLNVDVFPDLLADNKIRLNLTLQYDWPAPIEAGRDAPRGTVVKTALRDSGDADSRQRQADDRRAIGRSDRRPASDRGSESDDPAVTTTRAAGL